MSSEPTKISPKKIVGFILPIIAFAIPMLMGELLLAILTTWAAITLVSAPPRPTVGYVTKTFLKGPIFILGMTYLILAIASPILLKDKIAEAIEQRNTFDKNIAHISESIKNFEENFANGDVLISKRNLVEEAFGEYKIFFNPAMAVINDGPISNAIIQKIFSGQSLFLPDSLGTDPIFPVASTHAAQNLVLLFDPKNAARTKTSKNLEGEIYSIECLLDQSDQTVQISTLIDYWHLDLTDFPEFSNFKKICSDAAKMDATEPSDA